jgi:hypothetical protein
MESFSPNFTDANGEGEYQGRKIFGVGIPKLHALRAKSSPSKGCHSGCSRRTVEAYLHFCLQNHWIEPLTYFEVVWPQMLP